MGESSKPGLPEEEIQLEGTELGSQTMENPVFMVTSNDYFPTPLLEENISPCLSLSLLKQGVFNPALLFFGFGSILGVS